MFKRKLVIVLTIISSFIIGEELTPAQQEALGQRALKEFAQAIWTQAMDAKMAYQNGVYREDLISNFSTTAPRSEFSIHADLSNELQNGTESATVFVSMDNQSTWQSTPATLIGTPGFENTFGGTISTNGGTSAYSYLRGVVDSSVLDTTGALDYGTIIVSSTPHNINEDWPPSSNYYANLVNDPAGDAGSSQDIISIDVTYTGTDAVDSDGEEYTDLERFYIKMGMNANCCDAGGFFGPWYLYGVGIVNPEAEEPIAYAVGYGDGGFGQLTPGLLKISGDLSTGEIGGFEYLTTNIDYTTNGNDLQATALMSYLSGDPDWGVWPNSFNGFIVLGVAVEASLDGLDVAADVLDQTDPGMLIINTTFQDGNVDPELTNAAYDSETMELSVTYTDADGNLPWWRNVQICYPNGGNCFLSLDMIPDDHTYAEGALYTASLANETIENGTYEAKFWFADDQPGTPQEYIEIVIGDGDACSLLGDSNGDDTLNVLDVVLLVNIVLAGEFNECADLNDDGTLNVLDIVLLVNLILQG